MLALGLSACVGSGDGGVGGASAGGSVPAGGSTGGGGSAPADGGTGGSGAPANPVRTFVHPGGFHTEADFARMKEKVAAKASPWIDSWNLLIADGRSQLGYTPNPQVVVHRGDPPYGDNVYALCSDIAAAYACALRWKIAGDQHYADKAVQIMNAWSSTLTKIGWSDGHYDGFLAAGLQGYQFANVGEMMRDYPGWAAADFARFQTMMRNVFYSSMLSGLLTNPSSLSVFSSWDLCTIAAILSIAILCDDRAVFDAAINYFKTGLGNGGVFNTVNYIHPGYLGQTQESGRDQGHNTLSVALLATICEVAWNQGEDLYGFANNRVLAGVEYVSKGNLTDPATGALYAVPFAPYTNGGAPDTAFAVGTQGARRIGWASLYHHYVNRKGLSAPYTGQYMLATQPEGASVGDELGYGTLTFTRDPIASGVPPSGLTAYVTGGSVVLSWWGTAYATSYTVKRSTTQGGPYTTVATGIVDPRTYTDPSPAAGTYYYVVTATTPTGETAISNEAKAITAVQLHTHLTFDEGSGTQAADSSGNLHNAVLVNGAWGAGKTGSAVSLNGSNAYVSLPDDLVTDLADCTIAAWVYWNGGNAWQRIFDFGASMGRYMYLTPGTNTGSLRFAITTNNGVGEQGFTTSTGLPVKQWVHVAVTLAGATATLYVNGVAIGSNTTMTTAPFRMGPTNQNWLGRSRYPNDPYFNGLIDDFRIYHGVLTQAEIAVL
ncbi:LamG-like jellyroll fold domain-containing protein [Ralstonia sp. R-29]|uniref:LamG-like jellyroll fold domain-containing protein n=1 Tax=Ralstonia sp. R-29 TaxID=3404059 RepID=UPI003CEDC06F